MFNKELMIDTRTYTNPVYPDYYADPFVLRVGNDYYAYGTSGKPQEAGRAFEVLHSTDLITWTSVGGALDPLPDESARDYWAPEVAEHQGRFYMYYSAGIGDKGHQLRVAIADAPQGPFRDAGVILSPDDPFTIDASPFRDDDGQWYLYYARDYLDGDRVGTALAVIRLDCITALPDQHLTLLLAPADWQIYRHNRPMYRQIYDWYHLEGQFVVKHDGKYFCF